MRSNIFAALGRLTFAAALLVPLSAPAGESAATLYALNCMGCHQPPDEAKKQAQLLRGQFAQSDSGRVFFIGVPPPGARPLTAAEDARLLAEILSWKRSCSVILQQAPLVRYGGQIHVK
jgi:hypothetical protein